VRRLAPLLVLLVSGCGGSGHASSPSAAPPTRAQYVAEANRVCAGHHVEVAQLASEAVDRGAGLSRLETAASVIRETLPVLRRSFDRARALPAPSADAERIRRFWARADDSLLLLRRAAAAMDRGDRSALARARRGLLRVAADTRPAARELGLRECMP
jgi:hypothetical protein